MFPAPSPEAEQLTRELANDLMSPYCPGRTISSCPSQQARKLEDYILEQAEGGASREDIEQTLIARFGEETLGSKDDPTILYGSLVAALVGAFVIGAAARRWLRAPTAAATAASSGSPRPGGGARGSSESDGPAPSQAELDQLEDALDDLEEF